MPNSELAVDMRSGGDMRFGGVQAMRRCATVVAMAGLLLLAPVAPAFGHGDDGDDPAPTAPGPDNRTEDGEESMGDESMGGEEADEHGGDSAEARVLVLNALAYLADRPAGFEEVVEDKIGDALEAPDTEGVDLEKVEAAHEEFEHGDLDATRTLLQDSLEPMMGPVVGNDPGTTIMLDPEKGQTDWGGGGAVIAGLSILLVVIGVVLAVATRPRDSIRALKSRLGGTRP